MRKPIIFGNWKMNKTNAEAKAFIEGVDAFVTDKADFGVAVPFTALETSINTANNLKLLHKTFTLSQVVLILVKLVLAC